MDQQIYQLEMFFPFKICDPIHGFIRFDSLEQKVIDTFAFQRLRYLHQMGVVFLLYPGATHCRFAHSLGVMELATRIFDTITHKRHLIFKNGIPQTEEELNYYRKILRLAALCHDLGHLPFSHTAEKELLPYGGHERMTLAIIQSDEMKRIWREIPFSHPTLEDDIIKLSVGEKGLKSMGISMNWTSWERILSQVITEDNFGADRIDYLLRDPYYTGVGYGHFDYRQLIDTLRILPALDQSGIPLKNSLTIGIAQNGIQSVESLWIARYLMYARVYHHPKARIYSKHMARFMIEYFGKMGFPCHIRDYLKLTDYHLLDVLSKALESPVNLGHEDASALFHRKPCYKEIPLGKYSMTALYPHLEKLQKKFNNCIFIDEIQTTHGQSENQRNFSVVTEEGEIIPSKEESLFLSDIPIGGKPLRLYADREMIESVKQYLESELNLSIID